MSDFVNPQHLSDYEIHTFEIIRGFRKSIKKMEEDNIKMKYRIVSNEEAIICCKAEAEKLLESIKEARQ